jgi:hypothetical protein
MDDYIHNLTEIRPSGSQLKPKGGRSTVSHYTSRHFTKVGEPLVSATVTKVKGKVNPVQAWTGPEGSRRLRFPHFKTIGK